MKNIIKNSGLALLLISPIGVAQATTVAVPCVCDPQPTALSISGASSSFAISGYDGQPATVTGTETYGVTGTLTAGTAGTITYTYLGQESAYFDALFDIGGTAGGKLTESSSLGATTSQVVSAGTVPFSFKDDVTHDGIWDHIFSNGSTSTSALGYAFLGTRSGFDHTAQIGSSTYSYDYILGFNDSYSGDADYDDFVVGVTFCPSPVPLPAAAWLFGSALLGFVSLSNRRKV